jgi:hypothetical protein
LFFERLLAGYSRRAGRQTRNMTSQAFAVGLILVLIILVVMHLNRQKMTGGGGGGEYPRIAAEAFLYYDPAKPSPSPSQASQIASGLGVKVATPGQLAYYASSGGASGWYGITSTGDVLAAPGPIYSPSNYVVAAPCAQTPYGVWLYGPKPPVSTQNVSPFSCSGWFQPSP